LLCSTKGVAKRNEWWLTINQKTVTDFNWARMTVALLLSLSTCRTEGKKRVTKNEERSKDNKKEKAQKLRKQERK